MGNQLWQVWSEGFAATGEHGTAQYMGSTTAPSFKEACYLRMKAKGLLKYYNEDRNPPTYWGCRLFDNEEDARKSFG